MKTWDEIKQEITTNFPDNNNKEITALRLRTVLGDVVDNINNLYYDTEEINDQYYTKSSVDDMINNLDDFCGVLDDRVTNVEGNKQDKLVSGTNIKTLDGMSILGSGNINLPDVNIFDDGTDITLANCKQNLKTIEFTPDTETFDTVELTLSNGMMESNFVLATTDYKNVNIVVGTERKIGTWTEGGETYDLYEKVVNVGNLPNAGTMEVLHGVTNKVRFVETSGFAYGNNNINIPFVNANGAKCIYLGVGNTKITITTSSDRSDLVGYVTLRFIRARQ